MNCPNYSKAEVYKDLMGTQAKVEWANTTWNRATTPRSRFIMWLAYQDRLKTKQKLLNMGMIEDNICPICCTQTETKDHFFFSYEFSRQYIDMLRQWLKVMWNVRSLKDLYRKCCMPRSKVKVIEAILGNLVYAIWRARNEVVWLKQVITVRRVFVTVKQESKLRLSHLSWSRPIHNWVKELWSFCAGCPYFQPFCSFMHTPQQQPSLQCNPTQLHTP